ncbi:hypothetical protein [Clostridium niameyense]|uniref:hypothetical protein n=1 Tax=Clostridium niameyense TaxID=1622073 RepID=UPI00067EC05C|nr:hypothetical protein [Clostridium niameyense]
MLKISFLELFLRVVPESFLIVFLIYIMSGEEFYRSKYIISSCLFSISIYLIRFLPIHFGIHFILNTMVLILLCILINRLSIQKSIGCGLISMTTLALCELGNLFFLKNFLKINIEISMNSPLKRVEYFMPSLILLLFIVLVVYKLVNKSLRGKDKCI